ncbi:MAG: serine/threonine-protein kinase, partial [Myxococcota bacterium]
IKVLHGELISSNELVKRFEREIAAVSLLDHHNIAAVYERGQLTDGRPYFAMEYIQGRDLDAYLNIRGALAPSECMVILDQLASALQAAHSRGIVHRDLKASNVLLGEDEGGQLRVVLLDFGVAKLLEDRGPRLTRSRAMIGTPSCMAPEQVRCESVSAQTDVYALGALAYHMLTGKQPFWSDNLVATLYLHLQSPPPPPSAAGDVSPVFDEVVTTAMSKERAARYTSANEFVGAFRAALQHYRPDAASIRVPAHIEVASDRTEPIDLSSASAISDQVSGQVIDQISGQVAGPMLIPNSGPISLIRPGQDGTVSALGLYVHVYSDLDCLSEPDDDLLDDMESILPRVDRLLGHRGYLLAHDNGNSALYVRPIPPDSLRGITYRRQSLRTAVALRQSILARPLRDPRVRISIYLHVADARVEGQAVRGGPLLDLDQWIPDTSAEGIFGSSAMLSSLEIQRAAIAPAPVRFYRIATEPPESVAL